MNVKTVTAFFPSNLDEHLSEKFKKEVSIDLCVRFSVGNGGFVLIADDPEIIIGYTLCMARKESTKDIICIVPADTANRLKSKKYAYWRKEFVGKDLRVEVLSPKGRSRKTLVNSLGNIRCCNSECLTNDPHDRFYVVSESGADSSCIWKIMKKRDRVGDKILGVVGYDIDSVVGQFAEHVLFFSDSIEDIKASPEVLDRAKYIHIMNGSLAS